ncbi:MAG TPA: hypothetical protein VFH45_05300 [Acidimicrobiales bacterium]|nr:hypothetical protein [Acidimicrobiales bacterium]
MANDREGAMAAHPAGGGFTVDITIALGDGLARTARQIVADVLGSWGLGDDQVMAELVTGELVALAVRHGSASVDLRLARRADCLRIEVTERRRGELGTGPDLAEATGSDSPVLDGATAAWGEQPIGRGACLWAEVPAGRAGRSAL